MRGRRRVGADRPARDSSAGNEILSKGKIDDALGRSLARVPMREQTSLRFRRLMGWADQSRRMVRQRRYGRCASGQRSRHAASGSRTGICSSGRHRADARDDPRRRTRRPRGRRQLRQRQDLSSYSDHGWRPVKLLLDPPLHAFYHRDGHQ
jgi:hypothetical protein